jgi:5-methylcytosine-specific restriction protein B
MNNQFSQMTLYELRPGSIDIAKLQALLSGTTRRSEHGTGLTPGAVPDSDQNRSQAPQVDGHLASGARVLIIDEINRGNVSRIFGELITLIEPSKRTGAAEALEAVLPYSKTRFGVPRNVHLIGTMNTADRSLTGIDIALRRRFVFTEMSPQPDLLQGLVVEGIDIAALLAVINQRIEALLDRDHRLGHTYFMPLRQEPTLDKLAEIFGSQVLPLLQEYFFDDWQRIQWVLNDHRKPDEDFRFVTARELDSVDLFGEAVNVNRRAELWQVNENAFGCAIAQNDLIFYIRSDHAAGDG